MSRGNERYRHSRTDIHSIIPVVALGHDCRIVISHDGVVAEGRDDARVMPSREPRQCSDIEMIVVAVRYQNDINRRQVRKCDTWIIDALWPDEAEWGNPLRPYRVEQDVESRGLDEPARVADIANAPHRAFDARRRTVGKGRRCPRRPPRLGRT